MSCKLTGNIEAANCEYEVAGATDVWLANYYPANNSETVVEGTIQYTQNADGVVTGIKLPAGEKFYRLGAGDGTISFTDALLQGGNGGKYRQHTVNAVNGSGDLDVLNQVDALSLGKFIAVVLDKKGKLKLLGRTSGLGAPAGGADYNSGAQDADASGWTFIQQGVSMEHAPLVENIAVLDTAKPPVIEG